MPIEKKGEEAHNLQESVLFILSASDDFFFFLLSLYIYFFYVYSIEDSGQISRP